MVCTTCHENYPFGIWWQVKIPGDYFIYGGPNAGTVMDGFQLTGTAMVCKGKVWYRVDGSPCQRPFWQRKVNYMYHDLGDWELKDYSTMVKWFIATAVLILQKLHHRFQLWWYMTVWRLPSTAMCFIYGMAGGSVTDWTLYDSHYTERFMGTPANNAEGYKQVHSHEFCR